MYLDLVSSTMGKATSGEQDQSLYNYQLCSDNANPAPPAPAPAAPMPLLKNLDLNNLFQTLVASGIIPKQEQTDATPSFDIRPVDFKDPKSLKEYVGRFVCLRPNLFVFSSITERTQGLSWCCTRVCSALRAASGSLLLRLQNTASIWTGISGRIAGIGMRRVAVPRADGTTTYLIGCNTKRLRIWKSEVKNCWNVCYLIAKGDKYVVGNF